MTRVVNLPPNFTGSTGRVGTNPTASATFTIFDTPGTLSGSTCTVAGSAVQIGTTTVSTSGTYTFVSSGGTAQTLNVCDWVTVEVPVSEDATGADWSFTLTGTRN
jgi:hypothetical protein